MDNHKKPTTLNFDSILIISYGRSGSTLLQGILNSIDGVLIRGENMNMCFHLFKSYQAILETKQQIGERPQNPFYGAELLDENYFLSQLQETVKNLLLSDVKDDPTIRSYGFKEIRYDSNLKALPQYLDFLKKIFPNSCFIFNTRNKEDVVRSWISLKWKTKDETESSLELLDEIESVFDDFIISNEKDSFHIRYEDVVKNSHRLKELYTFLGVEYDKDKINAILKVRHSYPSGQKQVPKFLNKLSKKKWF